MLKFENNFLNKKINLGLDLQGGSYLLLEIDNVPLLEQKLQNFTITMRNHFKENNIRLKNFKLIDQKISFEVDENLKQNVIDIFKDQESPINPYYERFKSHEFEIIENGNKFDVFYSKQGLVQLKPHPKTKL